jgi:hypothetical protein
MFLFYLLFFFFIQYDKAFRGKIIHHQKYFNFSNLTKNRNITIKVLKKKNFFNTLEDLIINNIIKNNGKNKKIK